MASGHLPAEILEQIFQHIPIGYQGQLDHHSICLVSRSWYSSAIKRLYHSPSVVGKNYDSFTNTVCPSVNAHIRKTELALFIYKLDMSRLAYSGTKHLTARLLGRVKGQIEVFIAPAATFSYLAFSALSKCNQLRILNLEYVIESIDAVQLLRTVRKLQNLQKLYLRMAWMVPADKAKPITDLLFPISLRQLTISGTCEVEAAKLLYSAMEHSNITSLAITVGREATLELARAVYKLHLKTLYMDIGPRQGSPDWDLCLGTIIPDILYHCHELTELSIPINILGSMFFTTAGFLPAEDPTYMLRRIVVHPSQAELTWSLFEDGDWDQFIRNILSGHLKNLIEIMVLDRKDALQFAEMAQQIHGRLDELDAALFDDGNDRSGLFLAGNEEFS